MRRKRPKKKKQKRIIKLKNQMLKKVKYIKKMICPKMKK
jgi:hypothetical protein